MGKSKAKSRVLIADDMSPLAQECFKQAGIEVDVKTGLDKQGLGAIIGGYDGLVVRSATKVTSKVLEAADNLKVIGRAGIGVDNIDVEAATAKGIVVMNTPFGNSITTAEHAISLMLAVARQIPQANASTHAGKWEKSGFMGVELMGKTLGIIGCGNIGSVVADRAQGLKMKVIAYDPFLTEERADDLGVRLDRLLIAGASAGGGLAAGAALAARDRGGPRLRGQLLDYPMLDDRGTTRSTHQFDGIGVWDRISNETGWSALLGDARGGPDVSPYAAPARATDLRDLPPAFIDVGSAEIFRDEAVAFADGLWNAGGHAELHVWPGGFHAFDIFAPHTALSRGMIQTRRAWMARLLAD